MSDANRFGPPPPQRPVVVTPVTKATTIAASSLSGTVQFLSTNHAWKWLGLGAGCGGYLTVWVGQPGASTQFTLVPGAWVPVVPGLEVKIAYTSWNVSGTPVSDRLEIFTSSESTPAPLRAGAPAGIAYGNVVPGAVEPSSSSDGNLIESGYRRVVIQFKDNVAGATRVQSGETADVEVWWRTWGGIWCHNPSDDFDAAGLGSVTPSHDIEVYDVPDYFSRVALVKTSGNTLWANIGLMAGSVA